MRNSITMVEYESQDLKRMIMAIEHESKEAVRKINEESMAIYKNEKQMFIKQETDRLTIEFNLKKTSVKKDFMVKEVTIRDEISKRFQVAKMNKVEEIFSYVKDLLIDSSSENLIESTVAKMDIDDPSKFIAFCKPKDVSLVEKHFSGEIKTIPSICIGGFIICSRDGKIICDNSFQTRIDIFRESHLKELNKII